MYKHKASTLFASSLYKGIENCNLRHVMTILLENNGNPNDILPWKGISPFHLAIGCENETFAEDVTKLLIQFGGHPNTRSLDGMTPVHIAAAWGRTNLLHLLLLNGGDPWLLDEEEKDAFDYAYEGQHADSIELLNRFTKLDSFSSKEADVTPKFKVTLDKVMLYNRNAVLEYKTDSQFSPSKSRHLKCATTQTSPRENGLLSHSIVDKCVQNLVNNVDTTVAEESNRKFYSVIADLKDNNVTLRRGKQKKHLKGITLEEPEAEPCVSGDSLYNELLAVKKSEEGKTAQDPLKSIEKSLGGVVKEWHLNSIKKTGKSPSVSEMTLIGELKKWQENSIEKPAKSLDLDDKHLDYKPNVPPTADGKLTCKRTDSSGNNSFIKELKKWQADGFKNLKKPNCSSSSVEAPINWMQELKERQAEGLRDNKKQLSLETSQTQLVTSEVMVRVNPIASDDDGDQLKQNNHASSSSDPLQETALAMEPVLTTDCDKTKDVSQDAVGNSVEVISLSIEEVVPKPYDGHVPFDKQYSLTAHDDDEDVLDRNVSCCDSSVLFLPGETHKLNSSRTPTAIVDMLCVEDVAVAFPESGKHFTEACHDKVPEIEEVPAVKENPDKVKEISMPADQRATPSELLVNEDLTDSLNDVSDSASGVIKLQDIGASMLDSEHHITKQIDECSASSHELIANSPTQKNNVLNVTPRSNHDVEGSTHKVSSILPSEESFRRHLVDLSNNGATSSEKHFVDLDDWMTMDWMDHDEPLPRNVVKFREDNLTSDSDEDVQYKLDLKQEESILTENSTKSVRSSPDYFTCSEEIQALARYPGGKPKTAKNTHFPKVTVTSLPNMPKENCQNSLPFEILESSIGDDQHIAKTKFHQQISFHPEKTVKEHDTTASSMSDSDSFVSVSEDYIITDEEEGVVLLERRYLVPETILSGSDRGTSGNSSSAGSGSYDTDTLRSELKRRGLEPGPIIPSTKRVYVKRLRRLARNPEMLPDKKPVYSAELERTLHTENWYLDLSAYESLEREVAMQFTNPDTTRHWRQGVIKSSFCYLLLDPRITCNLPCRTETTAQPKIWSSFLEAIFYVGKGKRSRPYSHLYQAVSAWKAGATSSDPKIQHILDIWRDGVGVVCLHIFQNTIPVEAFTREAAIIDALMLRNLKNARLSEYYGVAATWASHKKKLLGVYLLYKAMLIFLNEGERQLRPADIGH